MAPPVSKPTDSDGKRLYEMLEGYASDGQISSDDADKAVKGSKPWGKINPKAKNGVDLFFRNNCAGLKLNPGVRDKFVKGLGLSVETFKKCSEGGRTQTATPSGSKKKNPWGKKEPTTPTPPTTPTTPTPPPEPQPETEEVYRARVKSAVAAVSKTFYNGLPKQRQKYSFSATFVVGLKIDPQGKIVALEIKDFVITELPKNKRAKKAVEKTFQKKLRKHLEEWAARQQFGLSPTEKEMTIEIPLSLKPEESPSTTTVTPEKEETPIKGDEPIEGPQGPTDAGDYNFYVIKTLQSPILQIYKRHLKQDSQLEGKVTFNVKINAEGQITSVKIVENGTGSDGLKQDLTAALTAWGEKYRLKKPPGKKGLNLEFSILLRPND